MYWWPIIQNLKEFLEQQPEMADIMVVEGAIDDTVYPRIEILWDDEGGMYPHTLRTGTVVLWVDTWVENTAPGDASAYGLLHPLQIAFNGLLDKWTNHALKNLGLSMNVKIVKTASDGGTSRPIAGSRTILEIEWRR
ncbi:MAG: hypothetical protein E6713_17575 [Sporomusaceae bacterium]|nr:hypothetical protein [Sporomusaceae bacterium]